MWKLKIKHKLLFIWLGSIVMTLGVMAILFEYQVAALHQKEARTTIALSINTLHQELANISNRLNQSAWSLSKRSDLLASMNMIDRYQDPQDYKPIVFDGEKRSLAQELQQHASVTDTDVLAIFDSKIQLAAFYLTPAAGGNGAGFVSFKEGRPVIYHQTAMGSFKLSDNYELFNAVGDLKGLHETQTENSAIRHSKDVHLIINGSTPLIRKRKNGQTQPVGSIIVGKVLGRKFDQSMSQATGMTFHKFDNTDMSNNALLDTLDIAVFGMDVPFLELDTPPIPGRRADHAWVSAENHFVGAVRIIEQNGESLYMSFSQQKDILQSTLKTFQTTTLLVFILTGLAIIPIGLFFLNRTISRPVENLVTCADNLRRGSHRAMEEFSGGGEFKALADSFHIMSTAVKAREDALIQSQRSLKSAQRMAQIGNWEWEISTGKIYYSDEICSILGRNGIDIGDRFENLLSFVHVDDQNTVKRRILSALKDGNRYQIEHRITLPDGSDRYVVHQGEVHTRGGKPIRLLATLQNITERYLLERAKTDLISTVSHELRTPLTSVTGTLGLAVGGALGDMPEKLASMLETANKNARRLGLLIDDLLDVEKISTTAASFNFKSVNVSELLNETVETNQPFADAHNVTLKIDDGNQDLSQLNILADRDHIERVLANLISNAAKFSPEGETVLIGACQCENLEQVSITVSDKGPGIPEDFRPYVFDRFTQADQSITRQNQKGGTGLGLAISKTIIDMHDGKIEFETICEPSPDHGTTFTFTVPIWNNSDDNNAESP